jgi:hypothetical protein
MLELKGSQAMAQPLAQHLPDTRRLRQAKVRLPTHEIAAEGGDDISHAASASAPRFAPHAAFEGDNGLRRDGMFDFAGRRCPQGVAEEFGVEGTAYRGFGFVLVRPFVDHDYYGLG